MVFFLFLFCISRLFVPSIVILHVYLAGIVGRTFGSPVSAPFAKREVVASWEPRGCPDPAAGTRCVGRRPNLDRRWHTISYHHCDSRIRRDQTQGLAVSVLCAETCFLCFSCCGYCLVKVDRRCLFHGTRAPPGCDWVMRRHACTHVEDGMGTRGKGGRRLPGYSARA